MTRGEVGRQRGKNEAEKKGGRREGAVEEAAVALACGGQEHILVKFSDNKSRLLALLVRERGFPLAPANRDVGGLQELSDAVCGVAHARRYGEQRNGQQRYEHHTHRKSRPYEHVQRN